MRRLAVLATCLALAACALASPATSTVIMNLGDFEDGTLGAWQQAQWSAGGYGAWAASNNPDEGWLSGYTGHQPSGLWQAVADHDLYYSTAILHRDFTVPMNADSLLLRLWYRSSVPGFVADMPTLEPGGQGQGMRIDVMSPAQPVLGVAGILATPFATSYPGNAADWLDPVTVRMSVVSLRGQTVRLRIAAMANTGYMVTGIDDVRLEGSPYVEVATSLPQLRDGAADWGDYDNDGDLDLALVGNDGTTRVSSIWRNDAGTFNKLLDLPEGLDDGDIKWLDLDRDGDLDVVVTGNNGVAGVLRSGQNLGSGQFAWSSYTPGWRRTNLALADFDGDGDTDVAGAGNAGVGSGVSPVWRNSGGGGLTAVPAINPIALDSAFVHWRREEFPNLVAFGQFVGYGYIYQRVTYLNNGPGTSFTSANGDPNYLVKGVYEVADADGDGVEEAFYAGLYGDSFPRYLVEGVDHLTNPTTPVVDDIPELYGPAARWMDDDADGDVDLFVSGESDSGRYTRVHRWNAGALAASTDAFPQLRRGACAWGDYDGDGDPDLLILGDGTTGPVTRLYRNISQAPNLGPSAPALSTPAFSESTLVLPCVAATDDHTPSPGLTYNFRAGTSPGSVDLINPDADPVTGRRRVAREGNAANRLRYTLGAMGLTSLHGPVYFAAQAVDGARCGGAWSPEAVVHMSARVLSVSDVPGDQGGQVRIRMAAGPFDSSSPGMSTVESYTIWQRVEAAALQAAVARVAAATRATAAATEEGAATFATVAFEGRTFVSATAAAAAAAGFPPGTWEAVATVPAMQQAEYLARVGTVADSGATGLHWSVYCVSAHTATTTTWWVSPADSGKSVDNIAPGVPQGVVAQYHTGNGNTLGWQPSADDDFQYFRVYRGDSPGFAIGAGTLAAGVAGTQWSDPAHDTPGVYYRVTAVDHNGNESAEASPGQVTDVAGAPGPAFALEAPSPSPFAGSTRIAFTLPRASRVSLEVYDASGRRLRTLASGAMAAGAHAIAWDGTGDGGARSAAGLLFVRLRADGHEAVRRVVALGGAR